jgi:hypothetical protein
MLLLQDVVVLLVLELMPLLQDVLVLLVLELMSLVQVMLSSDIMFQVFLYVRSCLTFPIINPYNNKNNVIS